MAEGVTKQVVGICEEVSEKSGWTAFSVNVGSQYPVRVSTKLEKLVAEARAVGQQQATWTYTEVESERINENTGKPYTNRYLQKVEVGGSPAGGNGVSEQTHRQLAPGDRERIITRQTALKVAGQVFSGAANAGESEDDFMPRLLRCAASMENWVYRDIGDPEKDAPF